MSELIEVKVPDIGDFKDVPVIEVAVQAGDTVAAEAPLLTLESDKATMDVPAPVAGVVHEVKVKVGDRVSEGSLVLLLRPVGAAAPVAPAAAPSAAPSAEPSNAAGAVVAVTVPDIGDFKDVPVIELAVKVGERVALDQPIATLESDKATMDVPANAAGVVQEIKVKLGDRVSQGSVLVLLAADSSAASSASVGSAGGAVVSTAAPVAAAPAVSAVAAPAVPVQPAAPTSEQARTAHASPSVRKFARELGVDLGRVRGSGPKGRIVHEDVQAFVKAALAAPAPAAASGAGLDLLPWPKVDFAKFGAIEVVPVSRIKKISGANLARNWAMIPHVTQFDEADITELEAFRKEIGAEAERQGVKVTMLAFLIKAVVAALRKYPDFNASLDGDNLVRKGYFHIGFAADTPNGLVVPVIRDADRKSVFELAGETAALAKRARDGKLGPADMQGGCFSISSLGGIGGTAFTPIINAPEVAILGVSKSLIKPVWDGKAFAPRLMLPLSLSYDHRVIDGAAAARFTTYLSQLLVDMRRILL